MRDRIFEQYNNIWRSLYSTESNKNFQEFINSSDISFIQSIQDANVVISIFNQQEQKSEYVTDNIKDILGYDKEIALKAGYNNFLEHLHPKHKDHGIIAVKKFSEILEKENHSKWSDYSMTINGLRFKHATKGEIRILVHFYFLDKSIENNAATHNLSIIQDVSHLLKDDFYWFRIVNKEQTPLAVYHSSNNAFLKEDILSVREKEILQMIIDGKESEEIAQTFSISKITVNNHRQNMLNKTGAKDTTALITIAKLCHLLD